MTNGVVTLSDVRVRDWYCDIDEEGNVVDKVFDFPAVLVNRALRMVDLLNDERGDL